MSITSALNLFSAPPYSYGPSVIDVEFVDMLFNLHITSVEQQQHGCSLEGQSQVLKIFDEHKSVIDTTLNNVPYADMSVQMFELSRALPAKDFKVLTEYLLERVFCTK